MGITSPLYASGSTHMSIGFIEACHSTFLLSAFFAVPALGPERLQSAFNASFFSVSFSRYVLQMLNLFNRLHVFILRHCLSASIRGHPADHHPQYQNQHPDRTSAGFSSIIVLFISLNCSHTISLLRLPLRSWHIPPPSFPEGTDALNLTVLIQKISVPPFLNPSLG